MKSGIKSCLINNLTTEENDMKIYKIYLVIVAILFSGCASLKLADKSDFYPLEKNQLKTLRIVRSEKVILNDIEFSKKYLTNNLFQRVSQLVALHDLLLKKFESFFQVDSAYCIKNWLTNEKSALMPWTNSDSTHALTITSWLHFNKIFKTQIIIILTDDQMIFGLNNNEDHIFINEFNEFSNEEIASEIIKTINAGILRYLKSKQKNPNIIEI